MYKCPHCQCNLFIEGAGYLSHDPQVKCKLAGKGFSLEQYEKLLLKARTAAGQEPVVMNATVTKPVLEEGPPPAADPEPVAPPPPPPPPPPAK